MPGLQDPSQFLLLSPEMLLSAAGLLLLLVGTWGRGFRNVDAAFVSIFSLVATGVILVVVHSRLDWGGRLILGNTMVVDGFAFFWKALILVATILTILIAYRFVEEGGYRGTELYALLLFATAGAMFMVSGNTLLTIWIGLETMALASYILAGYFKREVRSNEAALKYFILGALSSGILLYGMSLLYGVTGTIELQRIAIALAAQTGSETNILVPLGWILMAAGLFFKVAAVPFHIWTPDVYVGAPTPITAWLAVVSKGASFAILVRILYEGLWPVAVDWQWIVALVASASMIWGNLAALTQDNVKRLLAYSSIANAGYVLIGVLALSEMGLQSVLFYLLAYTFITLGAFGTVILLERREYAGETAADYAGLSKRSPFLAAMMLLFLLALTGIPLTGGFVGKLYLFAAAIEKGWTWVAVIGVITSAISLYYYFRIVVYMYQRDETSASPVPLRSPALVAVIAFCALLTLLLGIVPGPFLDRVGKSLEASQLLQATQPITTQLP
ncbi:MAG TPA: NADH-quinone oxidoreductase subunit N [Thermoanaerobaculia bacterium]|nr:NADH-quinone oxidoreductase subunit N [Thermoanaerobaculia bacterium]